MKATIWRRRWRQAYHAWAFGLHTAQPWKAYHARAFSRLAVGGA
jgi:hypothetical protein